MDSEFKKLEINRATCFYKQSGNGAVIYVPANNYKHFGKLYSFKYSSSCGWYTSNPQDLNNIMHHLGIWEPKRLFSSIDEKLFDSMKEKIFNIFEEK